MDRETEMLTACLNAGCDLKHENGDRVFLLPPNVHPTLVVVGPLIQAWAEFKEKQSDHSIPSNDVDFITPDTGHKQETIDNIVAMPSSRNVASAPRRRVIGFEMPSAELLAATATLTEAQAELRLMWCLSGVSDVKFQRS